MRQLKITQSITSRETASLEKYLQEIGKVDLISSEEEVVLARLIKQGDTEAVQRLIKANLRFVVSVAKQYQNQGLPLSDIINEGNVGLIKAAQRFDETRGFKFISYAVWWIRQSIIQALSEKGRLVRIPVNKLGSTNRLQKAFNTFEQQHEREPSEEELAEVLNIDLEDVTSSIGINSRHISFDTPLAEGEQGTLLDVMVDQNAEKTDGELVYTQSLKLEIARSLENLTERQKQVICYFFGIGFENPMNLEDIGEKFNFTRERARQIKDLAILKLRTKENIGMLRVFLGA